MDKLATALVFITIGIIFIYVSKRNISNRKEEMNKNFEDAIIVLRKKLATLMPNEDVKLTEILSIREKEFIDSISSSKDNDKAFGMWSAQQGIITVQDILIKIKKVKSSKA
ncbi:hypothetical protein [Oceanirhabdus sp. W0125-5]|uniref:hypothetical protein n=1 Tax=Oceanirhabdus sp. W0125-5 TaxID=2999116 RepID=UPI0022F2BD53|nr:hypothetical protein [Oceanirhabdus sp. W0125-5]WBW95732.1 hypothetical protein OW730_18815 [Oceanirhabdus sp. W0125-5]